MFLHRVALTSTGCSFPTPRLVSPKFPHVPLGVGEWPLGYEERKRIIRAISFQDFQPMWWSWSTNVTDRQTDDMRSQYRALHYSAWRSKKQISTALEESALELGHWVIRSRPLTRSVTPFHSCLFSVDNCHNSQLIIRNSAFHPSGVGKSSTGLFGCGLRRGGGVSSRGTLCDHIWQVSK